MQVTDKMVEAACLAYDAPGAGTHSEGMRAALEAALGARKGSGSKIVELLRAGHPYSGTTDDVDLQAAACIEDLVGALRPFAAIDMEDLLVPTHAHLDSIRRARATLERWRLK